MYSSVYQMKRFCSICILLLASTSLRAASLWTPVSQSDLPTNLQRQHPTTFLAYALDLAGMKSALFNAPTHPTAAITLSLPMPDGSFRDFSVWQTPMMPDELAAKYRNIKTFTGEALHNKTITVKLDLTEYGFHAMVFNGDNTSFIDPYDLYSDGIYMVHYMKNETRAVNGRMHCMVARGGSEAAHEDDEMAKTVARAAHSSERSSNGTKMRTYRLALSADSWYCQAATGLTSPSIAQALSAMTTSMNRINGVYERELSISMNFVAKEDTLIWPTSVGSVNGTDPFYYMDGDAYSCLTENQLKCDTLIGNANYDIGHVFTTGAGGLSQVGVVCSLGYKAQSVTGQPVPVGDGFDINYVAHEMGHEFGADHPFNDDMDGSCGGNAVAEFAYEPGSGTTIMAYAGICAPDDLQANSDAYFHAISLVQISTYISGEGDVCAVHMPSLNLPVGLDSFSASYSIPYLTPFELIAPIATDSTSDTLTTYCWDQWNLGDFGMDFIHTHVYGPLFRSLSPVAYPSSRTFPRPSHLAYNYLNDEGNENNQGEKVPDSARYMTFKLTLRDIYGGNGCFLFPDDTIHLDVINTGTAFTVSSQASSGIVYNGGDVVTITWNVAETPAPPINATQVDIYMAVDGGNFWMYHIGTFENSGSATITVPNPAVTSHTARFKVKGHNNVFLNINATDFTVSYNPSLPVTTGVGNVGTRSHNDIQVYPVPASGNINLACTACGSVAARIYNVSGRMVWSGSLASQTTVATQGWPAGVYYLSTETGAVKKIVIQ